MYKARERYIARLRKKFSIDNTIPIEIRRLDWNQKFSVVVNGVVIGDVNYNPISNAFFGL